MKLPAMVLIALAVGQAQAQHSALRITCEGDSLGAEVSINGVFKGDCPLDVTVKPGTIKITARKMPDATHEQLYQNEFRIGDGVAKRIELVLDEPRLTPAGARIEAERERLAAERRRAEEAEALKQRAAIEARQAEQRKLVEAKERSALFGSLDKFKSSPAYKTMRGEDRRDIEHILSLPIENYRELDINGMKSVTDFIARDAFFQVPAGHGNHSASFESNGINISYTCESAGRFTKLSTVTKEKKLKVEAVSATGEATMALGGLFSTEYTLSYTTMPNKPQYTTESIFSVFGQPFPLRPGARFGFGAKKWNADISTPEIEKAPMNEFYTSCVAINDTAPIVISCLIKTKELPRFHHFIRLSWSEQAGCLVPIGSEVIEW